MKNARFISLAYLILVISACTTEVVKPESESRVELKKVNVISVTKQKVDFDINAKFAWQTDLLLAGDEAEKYRHNVPQLKSVVEHDFMRRGYQFTDNLLHADYFLVGMVLLEGHDESLKHGDLLLGLDPGMHPSQEYGLGTLLIGVQNSKGGDLVWRGAVQVLTTNDEIPQEQKSARVKHAVEMLIDGLFDFTEK